MARTRSTKAAPSAPKGSAEPKATSSKYSLAAQPENPSKLFILPTKANLSAQIVTLPNPRHARPARYLVCPETGIYEFTQVSAPKTTPCSWLIETPVRSEGKTGEDGGELKAEVSMGAELYLATAIDPLFLLLPALSDSKATTGSDGQKHLFLSSDDHFDKLPEEASHLSEILRCQKIRRLLESRMAAICDTVDAGDESMFRLSEKKLLGVVLEKAKRMSESGLPASMEEKFVKKALEAPILVQKREPIIAGSTPINSDEDSQVNPSKPESNDSPSTVTSSATQLSTAASSVPEDTIPTDNIVKAMEASPELLELQRLRVAFSFICSSYIPLALEAQLQKLIADGELETINFAPLDEYLAKLAELRAEAMASRSVGDYSRKHGRDEEEEEARAEKKRKLEEEKKRKANESRGVRDLKKVNTKGMKKMSDFFKKK